MGCAPGAPSSSSALPRPEAELELDAPREGVEAGRAGVFRTSYSPGGHPIDKACGALEGHRVLRLRRIGVLLLLGLWLPALLHCRLEAAGILFGESCCETTHSSEEAPTESCADDACDVAEGEFTSLSAALHSASAPVLFLCLLQAAIISPALALAPPLGTGVREADAAPPEIARSWAFDSRAALSPRAPSLA